MKRFKNLIILILITSSIYAQDESIRSLLYKFSPLAEIIVRNLGMEDKNKNGVIDKNADEGYEQFIEKYGIGETFAEKEKNIDCGFHANYIIILANNGILEENEIVNYYYTKIRFKAEFTEETEEIENAVKEYFYAKNLPLVWLDDKDSTVMKAVNNVLGEGWNEQVISEDDAVILFQRTMRVIRISGRSGEPHEKGGYYTLPEFIAKRSGYCVETAQFGFWFFSQLKIRSILVYTFLNSSTSHAVLKLDSGRIEDYFSGSSSYNIKPNEWNIDNPLQTLGIYYRVKIENRRLMLEQTVLYDKYSISGTGLLMTIYCNYSFNTLFFKNIKDIIFLGEYIFENYDIEKVVNAKHRGINFIKSQVKPFLEIMLVSYYHENDKANHDKVERLLKKYYPNDKGVKEYLNEYRM